MEVSFELSRALKKSTEFSIDEERDRRNQTFEQKNKSDPRKLEWVSGGVSSSTTVSSQHKAES